MLLYILMLLLFILLLAPVILISFFRGVLSLFGLNFGKGRNRKEETVKRNTAYTRSDSTDDVVKKRPHKKIFDKDDGEYVDFEEIK